MLCYVSNVSAENLYKHLFYRRAPALLQPIHAQHPVAGISPLQVPRRRPLVMLWCTMICICAAAELLMH